MAPRYVVMMILLITTYEASSQSEMDSKALAKALRSGKTLQELGQPGLRIIGGSNQDPPYKYPSIVGLYWNGCIPDKPSEPCREGKYICAGSIYNKYWIVTAAHCSPPFKPPGPGVLFAIAGIHDISKPPEPWTQNVTVVENIRHELYRKGGGIINDIAIYRVNPPFKFSDKVTPMNIADFDFQPPGEYNSNYVIVNNVTSSVATSRHWHARVLFFLILAMTMMKSTTATAIVVGWGEQKKEPANPVLQEVKVPLITNSRCQRFYGWYNFDGKNGSTVVNQGMICAGAQEGGVDACQGDSGGPLFVYNDPDDTYTQIGIVSQGEGCAEKNFPGIYTRIGYFTAWIENQIQNCVDRKVE